MTDPAALQAALADRILVLDGAMGTLLQREGLVEADFRGARFADWPRDLQGNHEMLNLVRPELVADVHRRFLDAGADIIETNTFNANRISQADYGAEALAREQAEAGARIARQVADEVAAATGRPRWVAGAIGPTNKTASLSPDVNDPGFRAVTFDELRAAYRENVEGLLDGGVDLLLVETIFDTLNAKAALYAIDEALDARGITVPIMVSGTITDASGRTLSGQTAEAFWYSVRHARPLTIGLNCALGAAQMRPFIEELSRVADTYVCAYPNAGLPNEMGEYDADPHDHGAELGEWARAGFLNVVGGCCGTTPAHIAEIAAAVRGVPPRPIPDLPPRMRLAGLEPLVLPG